MKKFFERGEIFRIELRIDGEVFEPEQDKWAVLKFLDEEAMLDLLRLRMGCSEAEVREVLESESSVVLT